MVCMCQHNYCCYQDPTIENLEEVSPDGFHHFDIERTCELRQFVINKLGELKRGYAYFQFTCSTEDIKNNQEVLLMDKVSLYYFYKVLFYDS